MSQERHERGDLFKRDILFPRIADQVSKQARRKSRPLNLLDIGTGSGELGRYLRRGDVCHADLVDINAEILRIAARTYSESGIPVTSIHKSATELLPLEPGSIDVGVASFVLNQIEYPEVVFDLVYSYLSRTGRFIAVTPDEAYIAASSWTQEEKFGEKPRGVLDLMTTDYHFRDTEYQVPFFSRPNTLYQNWMGAAGFMFLAEELRVQDPFDPDFKHTPKALMLVGGKMPPVFEKGTGETRAEVRISHDSCEELQLQAVVDTSEASHVYLVTQSQEGRMVSFPFPSGKDKLERLQTIMRIAYEDDRAILVRRVCLKDSLGNSRLVIRIYRQGQRLANYVCKIPAASV